MRKFLVLLAIAAVQPAAAQFDGPCDKCGPGEHWIDLPEPGCLAGTDTVANHSALVGIDTNLDCVADTSLIMSPCIGRNLQIARSNPLDDSVNYPGTRPVDDHLDVIDTEIIDLCLGEPGLILEAGVVNVPGVPPAESLGVIAEYDTDSSLAESFFDVLFELDRGGGDFAYNHDPIRLEADIECVPPRIKYFHIEGCTPLYDVPQGTPGPVHVANLVRARHGLYQLEHFTVWDVVDFPVGVTVDLQDQFADNLRTMHLDRVDHLANAASKNETPYDEDRHLLWYRIDQGIGPCPERVTVNNQFGEQDLHLAKDPDYLLVPAQKDPHPPPEGLDHFLCYPVIKSEPINSEKFVEDQFYLGPVFVVDAAYFCNPVRKIHNEVETPIENGEDHLVFYHVAPIPGVFPADVTDQFVTDLLLATIDLRYLGVPSDKASEYCIPTVSDWGIAVLALLVLSAATVVLRRRRALAA